MESVGNKDGIRVVQWQERFLYHNFFLGQEFRKALIIQHTVVADMSTLVVNGLFLVGE